jgi:hypothetical protein
MAGTTHWNVLEPVHNELAEPSIRNAGGGGTQAALKKNGARGPVSEDSAGFPLARLVPDVQSSRLFLFDLLDSVGSATKLQDRR